MSRRPAPRVDWAGACALIVATGLAVGWASAIVISATPWTDQISGEGAALLNGIGQVLAGALATYLGSTIRPRGRDDTDANDPE